jgi:hypothetical protein
MEEILVRLITRENSRCAMSELIAKSGLFEVAPPCRIRATGGSLLAA